MFTIVYLHTHKHTVNGMFVVIDAQPELSSWSLDLDDNKIILQFSTVLSLNPDNNGMPIDCTAILIGPVTGDISMAVQLSFSAEGLQIDETMATCDLGMGFRSMLNADPGLGTDPTNTFLYYESLNESESESGYGTHTNSSLLVDSDNIPYSETMGVAATNVVSDNSSPAIASFEFLDLNEGLIVFSFTQPINVSTFNFTDLSLQNSPVNEATSISVSLTGGIFGDGYEIGRHITFYMTQADLEQIKLNEGICVSISTCYPHHTNMLVEDFGSNLISSYRFGLNYLLKCLILDMTSPDLIYYQLDLSVDSLTLVFSEPVDVTTFNPLGITFNFFQEMENITLTDASSVRGPSSSVIVVDLGLDADKIKISMLNISIISLHDVYVSLLPSAFEDIAGNGILPIVGLTLTQLTVDNHPPSVTSFTLDLNSNLLQITFSEPILVVSLNISAFKLTDSPDASIMIGLDDSFVVDSDNSPSDATAVRIASIAFGSQSLTRIKTSNDIGTTVNNAYLLIDNNSFTDTNGNGYGSTGPIAAAAVIADNSPATAIGFSLDMNIGQVVLTFSDVVNVSTWRNQEAFIQGAPLIASTYYYQWHGLSGIINNENSNTINVILDLYNLRNIKEGLNYGTATNISTTYLTIRAHAINDIRGVDIIAVTDGNGIQANDYVRDREPPQLISFQLNLEHAYIYINFDEPIARDSFNSSLFAIQGDSMVTNSSSSINLSNSSSYFHCYSDYCYYGILDDVLYALTRNPNIASNASTTYLVVMEGGVTDTSGNPINTTGPIPVSYYRPSRSKLSYYKLK